jgi:hypothetical protein
MDQDGVGVTLFDAEATALPFPEDEIAAMQERQARLTPTHTRALIYLSNTDMYYS